jgi:hypothetical protein
MGKTAIKVSLAILAVPILLVLLSLAGLFGYLPSCAAVAREFQRRHQGWQVLGVAVGGGDEDGRSYSIRYRKPPDPEVHEALWNVHCSGVIFGWESHEILDLPPDTSPRSQDRPLPPGGAREPSGSSRTGTPEVSTRVNRIDQ